MESHAGAGVFGEASNVYDRLVKMIFSGEIAPGTRVLERQLAEKLGVSRIPVRESLGRMVAQGLLAQAGRRQGIRLRDYTSEEIRQLWEYRQTLESGAAYSAARRATDADIFRMRAVCDQAESVIGRYGSRRWANLDHDFHAALADASHNERIADQLKLLLTECHYLFYLSPAHTRQPRPSPADVHARMKSVLQEHRELVELIRSGDQEEAQRHACKSLHWFEWSAEIGVK